MAAAGCLRAVGLQFWARSLQALPALLAPAVLLGLLLGAAAAALLCRCALGPRRRGEVRGAGGRRAGSRPSAAGKLGPGSEGSGLVCEGRRAREVPPARIGCARGVGQPGLPELGRDPRADPGGSGCCADVGGGEARWHCTRLCWKGLFCSLRLKMY